ncbi:biotin--[acetyl-CoA-carboxylase] ligase [Jannaschia sp. LMIT008]|uniref:biotin--[acetyl-CoA-carboxylase] ligase n=1 Tax=Jannaschia maritima TaxID=3032585 RepID=UPI002811209D|nr:biotin--[acetyl-CoA-carboxylase] ligase [Jannaschia sp. LMIT008]
MSWPPAVARVHLPRVDSTSAEATRRDPPVWVLADAQDAARGRRGRAWSTQPGNFAVSLAYRPPGTTADFARRSFVASLALADALDGFGVTGVALKWPNDVLVDGAKVAGILLEVPRPGLLVVGIGVNLAAAPEAAPDATAPPGHLDGIAVPSAFLDRLAPAYAAWDARLVAHGFDPVRTAWLARAARRGRRIVARLTDRTLTGTFDGIDADGHLRLGPPDGPATIPAADVFFPRGVPCC